MLGNFKIGNFIEYIKQYSSLLGAPKSRSTERYHRIILTSLSSGGAKITAAAVSFLTVPIALNYLGVEKFGLWMAISSVIAMFGFADLGIGSGVMNSVAAAQGRDDNKEIRRVISAGIFLLVGIASMFAFLFFLVSPFISWEKVLNITQELTLSDGLPTINIVVFLFALSLPSSLVIKVLMGMQKGYIADIWIMASSFASLACILFVVHYDGGLKMLGASILAPQIIAAILASIYFFLQQHPDLRPQFCVPSIEDVKNLGSRSGLFFILQIAGVIAFQSDYLILAHFMGMDSVSIYAVAFKLFTIPSILLSLFLNALWPAYTEAASRGDRDWIYKSFWRSLKVSSVVSIPISVALLVFSPLIIEKWVGSNIVPTWDVLIGLCSWSILSIVGGNFAALMNGLDMVKFQVIASLIMAVTNIVLSVWLVGIFGISGVIWGSVISLVITLYIPSAIYLSKHFR